MRFAGTVAHLVLKLVMTMYRLFLKMVQSLTSLPIRKVHVVDADTVEKDYDIIFFKFIPLYFYDIRKRIIYLKYKGEVIMYFYFLYKITLLNTGKSYIGYTNDFNRRLYDHIKSLETGTHINTSLQSDYKHGEIEIEVLESYFDKEQSFIQQREKDLISKYNTYENGYNQTPGGEGNLNYRNFSRDSILEAYAILKKYPNESTAIVQKIFNMSESAVLRLKNKQTYTSVIYIYERMSLEQKEDLINDLEKKYSLKQLFKEHNENVRYKSRGLKKETVFQIISIYENYEKKGAIMEHKLGLPSSHCSRIGRGIRYKEYFNEYQDKTPEEKLVILNQAKIFFDIK